MAATRSLASLPDVILREVLSFLLVDTPRAPLRTAILSTCSLLHHLGLPILYRVVDITAGPNTRLLNHLDCLFGEAGGLLTKDGRVSGLGDSVVELRVGDLVRAEEYKQANDDTVVGSIHLARCTHLVVYHTNPLPILFQALLPSLPVVDFVAAHAPRDDWLSPIDSDFQFSLGRLLGIASQPWPDLERVTFRGLVWYDRNRHDEQAPDGSWGYGRLSFSTWSVKTVVVDLADWDPPWLAVFAADDLTDLFLQPPPRPDKNFEDAERIELRVTAKGEANLRKSLLQGRRERPPNETRERLLSLIVFVGSDGDERRLLGADE